MTSLPATRTTRSLTRYLFLGAVASSWLMFPSACSCQRKENVEAKERLTAPEKKDPLAAKAEEKIDAEAFADNEQVRRRISAMRFSEAWRRLGSMRYKSKGRLTFSRGKLNVDSLEDTEVDASERGDFAVRVKTRDGSSQDLVYINEIFFLKNRNGKWRTSRDATGERTTYLEDAAGVWWSFYKLYQHALDVTPAGTAMVNGRSCAKYALKVPDESAKARAEGAKAKARPVPQSGVDGGPSDDDAPPEESADEKKERMDRLRGWRDKAHPAGGSGSVCIDLETGVTLKVDFEGDMAVGDGAEPSVLHVKIATEVSDVGVAIAIEPPKEAVEEVSRKKWPTAPRAFLEERGIVAPLPKEEAGNAAADKASAGDSAAK